MTVNVHYSISELPKSHRTSRGWRTTASATSSPCVKDFSKKDLDDRFVRYITRWNLEKADPTAEISPPKEPIIFWLEKTIPFKYRKPIRDGILEWNKAFEKAGFYDAIEVRQQPDDATWDPGDVNYNTFQWITAGVGLRDGPVARESDDRRDSRRRHHLRRRLPPVLEAGARDLHAGGASR